MREVDRQSRCRAFAVGLIGLLSLCVPALAQSLASADASLPVFSKVSGQVVAVGVTFAFDVEVYASPSSQEAAAGLERALMAVSYPVEAAGFERVREESTVSGFRRDGSHPFVLVRRFILRAQRSGTHSLPAFRFRYDGQWYGTAAREILAYAVTPGFKEGRTAVFPIMAERGRGAWRRPGYVRVGSAFLIAPDAVVTSLHVIMDARRVWMTLPDGRRFRVRKAWAIDPIRDVALLYVDPRAFAGVPPLELAPERGGVPPEAGHNEAEAVAFTYGWPGGVQRSTAGRRFHGVILQPGETLWITANPVRPGDSGGPLLDGHGRVLGAVSAGTVGGDQPETLHQEVCIAVDVRPALAQKLLMEKPRSLHAMMRAPAFDTHPYVQALRLTTMLSMGYRIPELQTSLAYLDAAMEEQAYSARLHFLRGVIYQLLGTRRTAAAAYRASLDAFAGNFLSAYMLAQHHLQQKEYARAEQLFRHTLQYEPYAYFAAYGLARTLMGRLRYEEAAALLRTVVAHDPAFAPAFYDLALCVLALGDAPRARQLVAKLEGLSPARARQLRYVLGKPLLQPRILHELPLASIPILPPEG